MRPDDEVFVTRCLEGDQPAFAFLVDKYKEVVHAYAYRKVGDYHQAEDIAQEVFIKAYKKLAQLKWPHKFRSWLYTIVFNECKLWLRNHSREREQEVSWEDVPSDNLDELAVRNHSDEDIELTVKSAMETLPDDKQIAISLFYMSSMSVREVAHFMGVSPNSVKIKLHRGRRPLGEELEKMIGKQLRKAKLGSGFVFKVVESIKDIPTPSLPRQRPTKWMPIPISIGVALLIGIMGFGVSSGKDNYQDMLVLKPVEKTYEVSLLSDADEMEYLDMNDNHESQLVALGSEVEVSTETTGSSKKETVVRRIPDSPNADLDGEPSPDGRYLSFAGWKGANLMAYDLTTGGERQITNDGGWKENVAGPKGSNWADQSIWSPDSKQLAYTWWEHDRYQLRVIGLDSSEQRVLLRNEDNKVDYVVPRDWSRDGKSILAYVGYGREPDAIEYTFALVSVADGSVKILKSSAEERYLVKVRPKLSSNGRYVAYDRDDGDIFLLATDGSGENPLVEHPAHDYGPLWTPDGKGIIFVSDRSGTPDLWFLQVADGKPVGELTTVKRNVGWMYPMGLTQNGSLYYGLSASSINIYSATLDSETREVLSAPAKAILKHEGYNGSPAWSPDGKHLAYMSMRRYTPMMPSNTISVLAVRSLATGKEREFILEDGHWHTKWASDGHSIFLRGGRGLNRYYTMLDVQTGDTTRIKPEGELLGRYVLSPDGKVLFYLHRNAIDDEVPYNVVSAYNLETGERKVIYKEDKLFAERDSYLAISPDGGQLAFLGKDYSSLKVMPTSGGEPRILNRREESEGGFHNGIAFTPDGRYILFTKRLQGDKYASLLCIPVDGGEPQKLMSNEGLGLTICSIHPDGQRIAFESQRSGRDQIWVMENFLPELTAAR
ncbi:sigma-70 family RNA polymerase sigma factor [Candidatus Poribacteria bacterium]